MPVELQSPIRRSDTSLLIGKPAHIPLINLLDEIGVNTGLKFAIVDRVVSWYGRAVLELSSSAVESPIPVETGLGQFVSLIAKTQALTWDMAHGIAWAVNCQISKDSPLFTPIKTVDYYGPLGELGPYLHQTDQRILKLHLKDRPIERWSVKLKLTDVTIRDVFAAVLRQLPTAGVVLRFYEFVPAEVLLKYRDSSNPEHRQRIYNWEILQDIPTLAVNTAIPEPIALNP